MKTCFQVSQIRKISGSNSFIIRFDTVSDSKSLSYPILEKDNTTMVKKCKSNSDLLDFSRGLIKYSRSGKKSSKILIYQAFGPKKINRDENP